MKYFTFFLSSVSLSSFAAPQLSGTYESACTWGVEEQQVYTQRSTFTFFNNNVGVKSIYYNDMFCLNENPELTSEMNGGGEGTFFVSDKVLKYADREAIYKITFQFKEINNDVEKIINHSGCFYLTKGFGNKEIIVLSEFDETKEFECDFRDENILIKQ